MNIFKTLGNIVYLASEVAVVGVNELNKQAHSFKDNQVAKNEKAREELRNVQEICGVNNND